MNSERKNIKTPVISKSNSTYGNWVFKIGEKHYFYFRKSEAKIALARLLQTKV